MTGELFINGTDAYTYGVSMGDKFLDSLGDAASLKEYVKNSSRMENGVRYLGTPMLNERSLTLEFRIESTSSKTMKENKRTFLSILYAGDVLIYVPDNSGEYYHLKYSGNGGSYAQNTLRTFCKMSVKFTEPDPTNRTE